MVSDFSQHGSGRQDPDSVPSLGIDQHETVADDQGISLEELSRAYAELVGSALDPYEPPAPPGNDVATLVEVAGEPAPPPECELSPRSILEAMLFVGHPQNEPLRSDQVAALMRGVMPREVDQLVEELNGIYREGKHPFQIVSAGAGYRLELCAEYDGLRAVFWGRVREARLSQPAVDILAIVAYQPGMTREQVDRLRSRPSSAILSQLVRRQLLRIERPDKKPRQPRYFTTDRFLQLFGLASLEELPRSQDAG